MPGLRAALLGGLAALVLSTGMAAAQGSPARMVRGQLVAWRNPVLASAIAGLVKRVPLRDGQTFAVGEVLVEIDCGAHQARAQRAQAQQDRARRQLAALNQLDRRGATSHLELGLAAIDVSAAEADLALAKLSVQQCIVAAPFAGQVVELKTRAGQYVREGDPLLEVVDHASLEVEFLVPSTTLRWLNPGQALQARLVDLGRAITLRVARIGGRVDPVSQVIKVYASLPSEQASLVAGMAVEVQLPADGAP